MVEASRGNLITCNPGEVHDGAPIGGAREWKMLYLAPPLVGTIVADIREGVSADFEFTEPVSEQRTQAKAFNDAYDELTASCVDAGRAQERLIVLLAGLLQTTRPSVIAASAGLTRAKARIDDDPTTALTLAELAREAGMSRFQVLRGFTKLTGMTPHAYLVQRRLDAARRMLSTGIPIADAAVACGFADQSHFNRTFTRRYGLTPGSYADAMRGSLQFCSISPTSPRDSIMRGRHRPAR